MQASIDAYEQALLPHRQAFRARWDACKTRLSPQVCALFLMNYCSQGVGMTRDVPAWIRGAGEATRRTGLTALGDSLLRHAAQEEGHHVMMQRDVTSLVAWWNERWVPALDEAVVTGRPELPAVAAYRDLHLEIIASDQPFAQVAVELEIERLSAEEGPDVVRTLSRSLGLSVVGCLSFLTEHVEVDQGHTLYNRRMMARLLEQRPESFDHLVAQGAAALARYGDFVEEVTELSVRMVGELGLATARRRRFSPLRAAGDKLVAAGLVGRVLLARLRAAAGAA